MKKTIAILAAAVVLIMLIPVSASATETTEVWWLVPEGVELEPSDHPQGDGFRVGSEGFPQTLLPGGEQGLECGRYAQVDYYPADEAYELIKDGVLTEGEDYDVLVSWRFVHGGDCEIVPVEPDVDVPAKLTAPTAPAEIQTAAR